MTEYYQIAGIKISITGPVLPARESLRPFLCEPYEKPDTAIALAGEPVNVKPVYHFSDRGAHWAKLDGDNKYYCFFRDDNIIISDALISGDWSKISVYANPCKSYREYFIKPVLETLFYNICILHRGIALHSAAVEWEGAGIVFSAPSGTGKSTQADLWVKNYGATYINGDRPILKFIDGGLFVCGTAWSGSAGMFKNMCVPMAALVFLEQYPENKIYPIAAAESLKLILPRCFLPYHDREMMALAVDIIGAVISRTACWRLLCTPDEGAAELVKECITENRSLRG